ncbi:MAG TPA: glycosyltransferase [Candidatus Limnocylindrales bacterium]|nr:glycosyltransferase [Candidatus Limnocylindrales bacterium]
MAAPPDRPAARRAVVLSHKTLRAYARTDRVARSLAGAGWQVSVVGLAGEGLPEVEHDAGTPGVTLRRVAPAGPLAAFLHERRGPLERAARRGGLPTPGALAQVAAWPLAARAWSHGLRSLPPADLYHACGLGAAWAARDLARRARREGAAGRVVYDMIDIFLEASRYPSLPAWRRALYRRREARLVRDVDGLTTVNDALADDALGRWGLSRPPLVLYNCPARDELPTGETTLLREAAGLPREVSIVLFLGRFVPGRGLLEAGDAVLRLPTAAFVALGYGPLEEELRRRDAARPGRHVTLPPVPPADVPRWAAGADATIFVSPGSTLNLRLSTPNKLWESLAGGTPIVYGRELEGIRRVVEPDGLGIAATHDDPVAIAAALAALLDTPPAERRARRERARRLVAERYAWDVHAPAYLELADRLVPGRG